MQRQRNLDDAKDKENLKTKESSCKRQRNLHAKDKENLKERQRNLHAKDKENLKDKEIFTQKTKKT